MVLKRVRTRESTTPLTRSGNLVLHSTNATLGEKLLDRPSPQTKSLFVPRKQRYFVELKATISRTMN